MTHAQIIAPLLHERNSVGIEWLLRSDTMPHMERRQLTDEEKQECADLKSAFRDHSSESQSEFGKRTGLGSQGNVGHYLNGRQPLSLEVAQKFADGLEISIASFSPRLARMAAEIAKSAATKDARVSQGRNPLPPLVYPLVAGVLPFAQHTDKTRSDTTIPTLVPPVVPWEQLGVALSKQYKGDGYRALAIPGQFGPNVQVIQYPDDSLEPEIQSGELIAVEPGIEPWPGDIVLARGKSTGQFFAGRYVSNRSGGYRIKSNKPDRYADADHNDADVVAVMVARLSGRAGTRPVAIKGF